jgi:serine/threonine protein kinase
VFLILFSFSDVIDLKPDNVGFTSNGVLKLFDFGLCTCVRRRRHLNEAYELTGNTGSLRYMAPEVALKKPYTEKADVYSFGIMLWQMARDRVPFKGLSRDDFMQQVVIRGERPKLDKSWPAGFSSLMTACWDPSPVNRPSFDELIKQLDKLAAEQSGGAAGSVVGGIWPRRGKMFTATAASLASAPTQPKKDTHSTWF